MKPVLTVRWTRNCGGNAYVYPAWRIGYTAREEIDNEQDLGGYQTRREAVAEARQLRRDHAPAARLVVVSRRVGF